MAAYVYILAGKRNGGFTRKYGVKMLVYFEEMATIVVASSARRRSSAGCGAGSST